MIQLGGEILSEGSAVVVVTSQEGRQGCKAMRVGTKRIYPDIGAPAKSLKRSSRSWSSIRTAGTRKRVDSPGVSL